MTDRVNFWLVSISCEPCKQNGTIEKYICAEYFDFSEI